MPRRSSASAHRTAGEPRGVLERSQVIERPLDEVFAFFSDAGNLERITPTFLRFEIVTPRPIEMRAGARIDYRLRLFGMPIRWRTHIATWTPGERFVDEQERGPFALWRHTHTFEDLGPAVRMTDRVEYREPLGLVGHFAHALFVRDLVERIFDHRRQAIQQLLG